MDRDAFFKALKRSRLVDEAALHQWSGRFAPDAQPATIASALVADAALTPYQAARVLAGRAKRLTIGQYRILDEIGRGGMGQVYKAIHVVMSRVVALKIIAPELLKDDYAVGLFQREVRAATVLQHPNIVMAFDANEVDGVHYLVMEYVAGADLNRLVRSHGPLPISLASSLLMQAARALEHAHNQGMVHRDIKPANLIVAGQDTAASIAADDFPTLKVLDFGLARLRTSTEATIPVRTEGAVVGTPDFISPEQAQNIHAADIRSDLYSLGCTFYFALTGRVPFPSESALEKILHHALEDPRPLLELRADVPATLVAVVQRLMEKAPGRRFQSPGELLRALEALSEASHAEMLSEKPASADGGRPKMEAEQAPASVEFEESVEVGSHAPAGSVVQESNCTAADWDRWLSVVAGFAARRGNRWRLTEAEYAALHSRVLNLSRERMEELGPTAGYFERTHAMIQPWLTLRALAGTDAELLYDLLAHGRHARAQLWGSSWNQNAPKWAAALFVSVFVLVGGVWLQTGPNVFYRTFHRLEALWTTFAEQIPYASEIVAVSFVFLLGILFLRRRAE